MAVNVVKLVGLFEAALDVLQKNKLKMLVEGGNFVFFFVYLNDVFGAGEGSRVTFAKMKDPQDVDNNPGWLKEATFTAHNLTKMGQGVQLQMLFTQRDLPQVEVISKEEALSNLEEFFQQEKDQEGQQ